MITIRNKPVDIAIYFYVQCQFVLEINYKSLLWFGQVIIYIIKFFLIV